MKTTLLPRMDGACLPPAALEKKDDPRWIGPKAHQFVLEYDRDKSPQQGAQVLRSEAYSVRTPQRRRMPR
jgi:hypothetical protein